MMGPRNRIRCGQDQTNPFVAARGDKVAMRPLAKLLCGHLYVWFIV